MMRTPCDPGRLSALVLLQLTIAAGVVPRHCAARLVTPSSPPKVGLTINNSDNAEH